MRITAAVVDGKSAVPVLQDLELDDELKDKEILVRIVACGVCRLDLECRDGSVPFPMPAVLGHEGTGVVERVGAKVAAVAPGDHVLLSFPNDGTCSKCLQGKPRQCASAAPLQWSGNRYDGSDPALRRGDEAVHGHMFQQSAFATHAIATEMNAVIVPKHVPLELFVIGCGIMTGAGGVLNVLAPEPGSSIVIVGAGAVGSAAIMAAKIAGCATIIAIEPHANRRNVALEIGATHVFDPADSSMVKRVKDITSGGSDYVLCCAPDAESISKATDMLKTGGLCGVIGDPGKGVKATFVISELLGGSKTIQGINGGDAVAQTFLPRLLEAHARGLLPLEKITRRYAFADVAQAFADVESGETIKPVVIIGQPT